MSDARFDKLTEGQKDCLRLYHAQLDIKQVAYELGISIPTVNQRLAKSRQALGVNTSKTAARLLNEHERGDPIYISPIYSPNTLPSDEAWGASGSPDIRRGAAEPSGSGRFPWPVPTRARRTNTLSGRARLLWVGPIALLAILVMFGIGLATLGLQDVITLLTGQHHISNRNQSVQGKIR